MCRQARVTIQKGSCDPQPHLTIATPPLVSCSSLQAGPLQGGVDHLPIRLRGAEKQGLSDTGSQAAGRDQVLKWDGVFSSPALSDVVSVETQRVTWRKETDALAVPVCRGWNSDKGSSAYCIFGSFVCWVWNPGPCVD